jgi:hypothetical protein
MSVQSAVVSKRALAIGRRACLGAALVTGALFVSGAAVAAPILPGWTCTGSCGTLGADGVVTTSPHGSPVYSYVTTAGGLNGAGQLGVGGTNGSFLRSPLFSANSGDALSFYFNYVTSDGAGFADYGWAALLDDTGEINSVLFTARTTTSGDTVPGFGLDPLAPGVSLTPASTPIIGGGPVWSALGGSSGACWSTGCGYTGWIEMDYLIPTAGNYYLAIAATNWGDTAFDTGMAVDGATIAGVDIGTPPTGVPAPGALGLFGLGLIGLGALRRRARTLNATLSPVKTL